MHIVTLNDMIMLCLQGTKELEHKFFIKSLDNNVFFKNLNYNAFVKNLNHNVR
jgi:hypothetical protein